MAHARVICKALLKWFVITFGNVNNESLLIISLPGAIHTRFTPTVITNTLTSHDCPFYKNTDENVH